MLVQVMAGCNLPTLNIRAVGVDLVPPQGRDNVRFFTIEARLELAHDGALFRRIARAGHLRMHVFHRLVHILGIVVRGTAQVLGDIDDGVHDRLTVGIDRHLIVFLLPQGIYPGTRRHGILCYFHADLPPLVNQPNTENTIRLVNRTVQQGKAEVGLTGFLQ